MLSEIDIFTKSDIEGDIKRIENVLSTDVFSPESKIQILLRAAFLEILVCLRDLMWKAEKFSSRISFQDDVNITDNIKDVTDLITYIRDALCHADSYKNFIKPGASRVSFNVVYGKCKGMYINGLDYSSEYEDDICFFFGEQKIYLKRHIIRALMEAKERLLPLLN